ncbi:MAG: hypothetical protein DRQ51_03560 [Gammaproteobacteria bacterium]|nr:MAG: hypothetical protein DRQ51_03560 [Gammaproteobacteria bacterium]
MKQLKLFTILIFLTISFGSYAANLKIGFVNVSSVVLESPQRAKAEKRLEQKFLKRSKKLEKEVKKFTKQLKALEKNKLTMSKEKTSSEVTRLKKIELKLKRDEKSFADDLNFQRNEELKKIRDAIFKVIKAYAEKYKYNMIFTEAGVLYSDAATNISSKILEALKKEK